MSTQLKTPLTAKNRTTGRRPRTGRAGTASATGHRVCVAA